MKVQPEKGCSYSVIFPKSIPNTIPSNHWQVWARSIKLAVRKRGNKGKQTQDEKEGNSAA